MPSFGEKLKLERIKHKTTLEQISASTKIGVRMLQALEEDKFDQLPGGIFNKGFVRAYARFLGLDEDQTVADYLEASGDAPPVSTEIAPREDGEREYAENVSRLEAIADIPTRQLPWGLFAAVLLAVAIALSLWSCYQREHAKQLLRPTPATAAAPVPASQLSSKGSGKGSGGQPTAIPASPSTAETSLVAPTKLQGVAPQDRATVPAPAATPGEFTVVVKTREESWITIAADGRTRASELLPAGAVRTVRGRKEIIVRVGNAAAVDFLFNGKKLDLGGEIGQVMTVTFGPQGIAPNAPEPPSTP